MARRGAEAESEGHGKVIGLTGSDERDGQDGGSGEAGEDYAGEPGDRPWTPIPRQAKSTERGLIPPQRRLKKTSRSA